MDPNKSGDVSVWRFALYFSGLGFLCAFWIVIGFLLGSWIVQRFEWSPVWKGIGAIAGIFAGIAHIAVLVKRFLGDQSHD